MSEKNVITHQLPFDPTYGYDQAKLQSVAPPPAPDNFASFWRETYRLALAIAPRPTLKALPSSDPNWELFEVDFDGLGGFRVGGWLAKPKGRITGGFIVGHGYGGREGPDAFADLNPNLAYLFVCGRGFNRSSSHGLPNNSPGHVLCHIQSREKYVLRYCVADMWSATTALIELVPETQSNIGYRGCSFGGGIGSLAIPWEPRWTRGILEVPTFGHHPLRLTMQMNGSGEAVRHYYRTHSEVTEVLQYYDAAIAMSFTQAPCLFGVALFDPAVPPPGQWAVANGHPGKKQIVIFRAHHWGGHEGEKEDQSTWRTAVAAWENKAL